MNASGSMLLTIAVGVLALLDEVLEVLFQVARGLSGRDVSQERRVELLLHLQGDVRIVGRDRTRARVLEGLPGKGNDGDTLPYLGVVVEIRPCRQVGAFDGPI